MQCTPSTAEVIVGCVNSVKWLKNEENCIDNKTKA
jgi:hypothetical protein